eukprot:362760-Chlamydomonas_euryale.AAC.2
MFDLGSAGMPASAALLGGAPLPAGWSSSPSLLGLLCPLARRVLVGMQASVTPTKPAPLNRSEGDAKGDTDGDTDGDTPDRREGTSPKPAMPKHLTKAPCQIARPKRPIEAPTQALNPTAAAA